MDVSELRVVVASDVCDRDGIGIELYFGNEMLMEVFRDDARREREITLYRNNLPLSVVEFGIHQFKQEVTWDYAEER